MVYTGKKHVQASGAKAGSWVNCTAAVKCRNGGLHISDFTLTTVSLWLSDAGKDGVSSRITEDQVKEFLAVHPDGNYTPKNSKVAARKPPPSFTPIISKGYLDYRVPENVYKEMLEDAKEQGVEVVFTEGNKYTPKSGQKYYKFEQINWIGPEDAVDKVRTKLAARKAEEDFTTKAWGNFALSDYNDFMLHARNMELTVTHGQTLIQKKYVFAGETMISISDMVVRGNRTKVTNLINWLMARTNN